MFPIHTFLGHAIHGDCIRIMQLMPDASVDQIVTDPPYLVNYRSRDGRRIVNDDRSDWLGPASAEMYGVLKPNSYCISFYGWQGVHHFMEAWKQAVFSVVGHFIWTKSYASRVGFTQARHENAYLLVKGRPAKPENPPSDVLSWQYTGNRLHPTQKPVMALSPLISAYSRPGDIVLDPFAGSATTAVAARQLGRVFIAIEMDEKYHQQAHRRFTKGTC